MVSRTLWMRLKSLENQIVSALVLAQARGNTPIPQEVADKFGAKCLNGSPPTFEITRNESSNKWVLFLEGGGWCYGPDESSTTKSCAGRGGFVWPPTSASLQTAETQQTPDSSDADRGGIMAQDPLVNPDFHTWNKVFFHYCDGASFGGGRIESIAVSKKDGTPGELWLRGRNNFNALVDYMQTGLGMASASEVILSGGSAGGLAVFYNLDHLATLLPQGVRLTGFPDAGFFLDAPSTSGEHVYRSNFQGADPVWNVTGGGGTNLRCLAANGGEEWKCLMAPYIAEHIQTPIFVMNSAYDAWQMGGVLHAGCIPAPNRAPCTADQNASLQGFRDQFLTDIAAVTANKPNNGVYVDSCYVHEQNVNFCSGQGMPNCVGWSPLESGSKKWGYSISVRTQDGRSLTPQQAFGAYYHGDRGAAEVVDGFRFPDNPTCFYWGEPAPPVPTPAPPTCVDFSGNWVDDPAWTTPVVFTQSRCSGSFEGGQHTFTVEGKTLTTSASFHGGLTGTLVWNATHDVIQWSNDVRWERKHGEGCADFNGDWVDDPHWLTPVSFEQQKCAGTFGGSSFTVVGDRLTTSSDFHSGLSGTLVLGDHQDVLEWSNGDEWERNHALTKSKQSTPLTKPLLV